jgi:hypothetical protein
MAMFTNDLYLMPPMQRGSAPRDEDLDATVDAVVAALGQLARSSACCGGGESPLGMAPRAPGLSDVGSHGRRKRGRHRTRPVSRRFVLPQVTVVEPTIRREEADVLVADGRIVDVVPPGGGPYQGYDVLDAYRGCFITPALVDMHAHTPPHNILSLIDLFFLLFLTHGVTTIRDAGDTDGTALPESLDGLATGRFIGPRTFAAGPFIIKGSTRWSNVLIVNEPGDADRIARTLVARGAKCMKLYENLTVDEIAALERAASEHGLVTLGHVPTRLGFEEALLADAQHFFGIAPPASLPRDHVLDRLSCWGAVDDQRMDLIVRTAVEKRRANTPTLVVNERLLAAGSDGLLDDAAVRLLPRFFREVVWHPQHGLPAYRGPTLARTERLKIALEKKLELVGRLYRAGATLRLGTDFQSFVIPGNALHMEMRLFERAGIPTSTVLRMATRDAALALGQEDLGVIRKRAIADLLVCKSDPSQSFDALSSIRAVVHDGALYASEHLWNEINDDLGAHDRLFERVGAAVLARISMWSVARRFVG